MYASAGVLCELYNGPTDILELNFDDAHGKSEKKEEGTCC